MEALVLVVAIGLVLLGGGMLSQRAGWPLPLVLIAFGILAGFVPFLRGIELPPELVLLLFLPALLYWESLNTSLREIRANLRIILLLSIVLVIATATIVALVGHAFGLSWPMAIALGAILSPTDATAVGAFIGKLPRRADTIARAESLLNDGTALVIYSLAVSAAVSGAAIEPGPAVLRFFESYLLGGLIGLVVGFAVAGVGFWLSGRKVGHTRYRPDPWRGWEWFTALCGVAVAVAFFADYTLSPVALAGLVVATLPAFVTPEPASPYATLRSSARPRTPEGVAA